MLVRHAVGLAHFPERAAEPARSGPGPVMIEERVPQLVEQQSRQHAPRDFVTAALAGDVAAVELDHLGCAGGDAGDAGPQHDTVVPVPETRHDQQAPGAA